MKLMFYHGPGDLVTRTIRMLTYGPYSHVELQFSSGRRFFSSGHGEYVGSHMIRDHKVYPAFWDEFLIDATDEQEQAAQQFAFGLIGIPFDWPGLLLFLLPWHSRRKQKFCSAIVLEVLQRSLHMYPGIDRKISPNGLHRLLISAHPTIISTSPSKGRRERGQNARASEQHA